jgi:hypothetical protein
MPAQDHSALQVSECANGDKLGAIGAADDLLPASSAALLVTLFLALTAVQFVISAGALLNPNP